MLLITPRQKRLTIRLVFAFPELACDRSPESNADVLVAVRMGPPMLAYRIDLGELHVHIVLNISTLARRSTGFRSALEIFQQWFPRVLLAACCRCKIAKVRLYPL